MNKIDENTRPKPRREGRPPASAHANGRKSAPSGPSIAARKLAAVVDTLDLIEQSGEPADRVRHVWLREQRAPGPRNGTPFTAAIRAEVFALGDDVLRHRGAIDWLLAASGLKGTARNDLRVAAREILLGQRKASEVSRLCSGRDGALPPLRAGEEAVLRKLETLRLDDPAMPAAARYSIPGWIEARLRERFGAAFDEEMQTALRPAPVDLRVNTLKATREEAMEALKQDGLHARPCALSSVGLRLPHGAHVARGQALDNGIVEVQDEGSQLIARLVEPEGAKLVIDFCAGAGGKTLAIAAIMANKGRLIATDVLKGRIDRAKLRLRRAGVHNAECREIEGKWLKRHAGEADRVIVDAPCTGTGVWRRKPDARWSLGPKDVRELVERQAEILDRAAKLVKPGGRLIYSTCTLLREEDEAQVAAFLQRHPDFTQLDAQDIWARAIGGAAPFEGKAMVLTPGRHGTDGFFAAVMERKA